MRNKVQGEIDGRKGIEDRRRMGQFSTPGSLAYDIVAETTGYLDPKKKGLRVLEPSMGTGAFVSAALKVLSNRIKRVCGYELDDDFFHAACELWKGQNVEPRQGDFTRAVPERIFDVVFANPPYVRHHVLGTDEKRRLQSLVRERTGMTMSGLAGLYCHFLLCSQAWMKPSGIGVWLIPAEWMSVNYGSVVREFLTRKVTLLRVHRFDVSDVRFSDALVSSCVVWFRNVPPEMKSEALFTFGDDLHEYSHAERLSFDILRKSDKWPPSEQTAEIGGKWRIGDYFKISRGVVTGDNSFFVMTEEVVRERQIPARYLKPILPSPRNLPVDHVRADEDGLPLNAERRFLLDCSGYELTDLPLEVRKYLETGLKTTACKNLCASRDVWYEQEKREVTPFLCSYMGRGSADSAPVRFVLNDSRAIVSNSFLMMYPKSDLAMILKEEPSSAETVWTFLTRIPREAIVAAGRSYGGGLQKVEPRELASVPCDELHNWLLSRLGANRSRFHSDDNGNLLLFENR